MGSKLVARGAPAVLGRLSDGAGCGQGI